jgi:hypothetical protein
MGRRIARTRRLETMRSRDALDKTVQAEPASLYYTQRGSCA